MSPGVRRDKINQSFMTPTLKVWLSDADAFELSEDLQKGFLFCLGLELSLNAGGLPQEKAVEQACKLSSHATDIPEGRGGDFYDGPIADLLSETGHKLAPDFSPRVVYKSRDGKEVLSLPKPTESRLPDITPDTGLTMRRWDQYLTALYCEIGKHIAGEPGEDSFLSGVLFASSYYPMDPVATGQVAGCVSFRRPPHLEWFRYLLHLDAADIQPGRPIHKIIQMFLMTMGDDYTVTRNLAMRISDMLHFREGGLIDEEMTKLNLRSFVHQLLHFRVGESVAELLSSEEAKALRQARFEEPPDCATAVEGLHWLNETVKRLWDYSVMESGDLAEGEKCTQKSCAMLAFAVAGLMNPTWNRPLYDAFKSHSGDTESPSW